MRFTFREFTCIGILFLVFVGMSMVMLHLGEWELSVVGYGVAVILGYLYFMCDLEEDPYWDWKEKQEIKEIER